MTEEKRRFSRIVFEVAARLTVNDNVYNLDRMTNLSVGGCLLSVSDDFEVEQECIVTILLDRMEPGVVVHGRIARVTETEVSIQFTAVTPENLQHLQNIIRYNAEDPDSIEEELSVRTGPVSYTRLTLPPTTNVALSQGAGSLQKSRHPHCRLCRK